MKKVLYFLLISVLVFSINACKPTGNAGEISISWKGYISTEEGDAKVTINFSGSMASKDGENVLTASKLTISGDDFIRNVEFNTDDVEKSSNYWIFRTKSSNPSYPYGIVSISKDYKSINGQLPDQKSMTTFYSEDSELSTYDYSKDRP